MEGLRLRVVVGVDVHELALADAVGTVLDAQPVLEGFSERNGHVFAKATDDVRQYASPQHVMLDVRVLVFDRVDDQAIAVEPNPRSGKRGVVVDRYQGRFQSDDLVKVPADLDGTGEGAVIVAFQRHGLTSWDATSVDMMLLGCMVERCEMLAATTAPACAGHGGYC